MSVRLYVTPHKPSSLLQLMGIYTHTHSTHRLPPLSVPSEADVVVIGAGLGGLCCAALLARYGLSVVVVESHGIAGGAAHSFERNGYHFDSGPSLFSGLSSRGPQANPLALVRCRKRVTGTSTLLSRLCRSVDLIFRGRGSGSGGLGGGGALYKV